MLYSLTKKTNNMKERSDKEIANDLSKLESPFENYKKLSMSTILQELYPLVTELAEFVDMGLDDADLPKAREVSGKVLDILGNMDKDALVEQGWAKSGIESLKKGQKVEFIMTNTGVKKSGKNKQTGKTWVRHNFSVENLNVYTVLPNTPKRDTLEGTFHCQIWDEIPFHESATTALMTGTVKKIVPKGEYGARHTTIELAKIEHSKHGKQKDS